MQLTVVSSTGTTNKLTVSDEVFAAQNRATLLAQAIRVFLANARQATSKVQTRSEVSRTKKKWFRQKGTGNARHGARSSNIFVGGGVSHGPNGTQNFALAMPKRMVAEALKTALSLQIEKIIVNDEIGNLKGKTAHATKLMKQLGEHKEGILVVLPDSRNSVLRSLRNLPYVEVTQADRLNVLQVVRAKRLIFTEEAIRQLETRLGVEAVVAEKKPAKKTAAKSTKETK